MSDVVLISLISGSFGLANAVLSLFNHSVSKDNKIKITEVAAKVDETHSVVKVLTEQTNGIKDALMASTDKAARAEGKIEGVELERGRQEHHE